jgi:hypothetical protein
MAVDTNYALTIAQGIGSVAPANSADPGAPTTSPTGPGAPYVDLGALSTDGLTENPSQSRTEFKRWGSISPVRGDPHRHQEGVPGQVPGEQPERAGTGVPGWGGADPVGVVDERGADGHDHRRADGRHVRAGLQRQPTTDLAFNASTGGRADRAAGAVHGRRGQRDGHRHRRLVLRAHLRWDAGGGERGADRRGRQLHRRHVPGDLGGHDHGRLGGVAADHHR